MLGRLSSVLWVLGCTDLHHENLILSSNQLVLVDAETIFDSPITSDFDSNIAILPTKLESLYFAHYSPAAFFLSGFTMVRMIDLLIYLQ